MRTLGYGGDPMEFQFSEEERSLLLEVLQSAHTTALHELHHTDSHDFKNRLKKRIEMLEALEKQIEKQAA